MKYPCKDRFSLDGNTSLFFISDDFISRICWTRNVTDNIVRIYLYNYLYYLLVITEHATIDTGYALSHPRDRKIEFKEIRVKFKRSVLRRPSRTSFFVHLAIFHPLWPSTLQLPGRQRVALGNFVHRGGNRVRDRHPAIWVNRLLGNKLGKLFLRVISDQLRYTNAGTIVFYHVGCTRYLCIITTNPPFPRPTITVNIFKSQSMMNAR